MIEWWVFALASAVTGAFYTLIEKKILIKEHALQFSAISSLVALVFCMVFLPKVHFGFGLRIWVFIIICSILSASGFLLAAKAFRHMQVSVASSLNSLLPLSVLFFSVILVGEGVSKLQCVGIMFMVLGVYVLESRHHHMFNPFKDIINSKPLLCLFGSLVIYGISGSLNRIILKDPAVNIYTILFFKQLFATIFLVMLSAFVYGVHDMEIGWKKLRDWLILLEVVGIISSLVYFQAVSMAAVPLVTTIERLSVFLVIILSQQFFHEGKILKKLVSAVIMIIGAILTIL